MLHTDKHPDALQNQPPKFPRMPAAAVAKNPVSPATLKNQQHSLHTIPPPPTQQPIGITRHHPTSSHELPRAPRRQPCPS
jgi:hypothetical protein